MANLVQQFIHTLPRGSFITKAVSIDYERPSNTFYFKLYKLFISTILALSVFNNNHGVKFIHLLCYSRDLNLGTSFKILF